MMSSRGKILVIDDNQKNREMCMDNLEMENFQVVGAEDGRKGLQALQADPPDLILLDIMMPEVDGYEVLRRVRDNRNWRDIPVLMLTAKASTEDVVAALDMGANDYLKKPFDIDELVARTETLVRLKQLQDQLRDSISRMEHRAALGIQAAGAAHDWNNILGILSFHQVIQSVSQDIWGHLTLEQRDQLAPDFEVIDEGCRYLAEAVELGKNLCASFTSLATSEKAGWRSQSIVPVLAETLKLFQRQLEKRSIAVHTDFHDIQEVRINAAQVQRVMLNLLTNAMQAMEGTDDRQLQVAVVDRGEHIQVTVSDSGIGIAEDHLPHVFESLFTSKENGSGLGLSTVKSVMDAHNGEIEVHSTPGEGSTFVLSFPVS